MLTNKLLTESGSNWHTEPTRPTLGEPNCLWTIFSCFNLCHSQTQQKSAVLSSSKGNQKEVSFRCGTISHVAGTKFKQKYFTQLWQKTSCGVKNKTLNHVSVIAKGALTLVPNYPCSQLVPLSPTHPHNRGNGTISEKSYLSQNVIWFSLQRLSEHF